MQSFSKEERLKSLKTISRLFKEGQSYMAYPFRVVWLPVEEACQTDFPAQICISVPKRTFKTAVARNRLKRQTKEAYRLQKELLYQILNADKQHVAIMLMYVAKEALPFTEITKGVAKMIKKFPVGGA
jgi:ribonuclease P protein component